jgi:hypothetical protein
MLSSRKRGDSMFCSWKIVFLNKYSGTQTTTKYSFYSQLIYFYPFTAWTVFFVLTRRRRRRSATDQQLIPVRIISLFTSIYEYVYTVCTAWYTVKMIEEWRFFYYCRLSTRRLYMYVQASFPWTDSWSEWPVYNLYLSIHLLYMYTITHTDILIQ